MSTVTNVALYSNSHINDVLSRAINVALSPILVTLHYDVRSLPLRVLTYDVFPRKCHLSCIVIS